ncbi:MAG: AmmeMemoRadiSam system protein A, partial [Tepidisphaeraceae bacterium]
VLLDLARRTIREALRRERAAALAPVPLDLAPPFPVLRKPAGCFVSLHEGATHALRGCVGRLDAGDALWLAVQGAALGVLHDPRFTDDPVRLDELPRLAIEVSVLSPLLTCSDALDFDLLNDGVYLTFGQRTGCFLPQVARETGWTKEQLLERLCTEKLGVPSVAWRHPDATLHRFKCVVVGPAEFSGGIGQ